MSKGGASRAPTGNAPEDPKTGRGRGRGQAAVAPKPPAVDLSHEPLGDDLLVVPEQGMELEIKTMWGLLAAKIKAPANAAINLAVAVLIGVIALVMLIAGLGWASAQAHLTQALTALVFITVPLIAATGAVGVVALLRGRTPER